MRTAILSTFVALIGLHALEINGKAACHSDQSITIDPIFDLINVQDVLSGPIANLCSQAIQTGDSLPITYSRGDITFQVIQSGTHSATECKNAFDTIVAECIRGLNVEGGKLVGVNGTAYDIYRRNSEQKPKSEASDWEARNTKDLVLVDDEQGLEDMHLSLDRRTTPKGGRAKAKAKKPHNLNSKSQKAKKSKTPKPKTPKPKTPKPKTPKPKTPKPKTPKPKATKAKTSKPKTTKASQTASAPRIGPTKTCKKLYAEDLASRKKSAAAANLISRGEAIRQGFIGSRLHIEKRLTDKKALACGLTLSALDYPEHRQMPSTAKYYGFTQPAVCDVFSFSGSARPPAGEDVNKNYDIEHVLEWQVVTYFFDWVQDQNPGRIFDDPDANSKKKVNFCRNWKETWLGSNAALFDVDGETRTVAGHLRHAYPGIELQKDGGNSFFVDEFVFLNKAINSPAKTQMWNYNEGKVGGVYSVASLNALIIGKHSGTGPRRRWTAANINSVNAALNKLRYLIGARIYMRNPAIAEIFKKQKERMGDIIGKIDMELPYHPRVKKGVGKLPAWKSHNLKNLWNQYMDERFRVANQRINHDMDTYLKLLFSEWQVAPIGPSDGKEKRELYASIQKVESEWKKEKRIAWVKPW